jgi:hypothetical protein
MILRRYDTILLIAQSKTEQAATNKDELYGIWILRVIPTYKYAT